jgi:hypothetical protein
MKNLVILTLVMATMMVGCGEEEIKSTPLNPNESIITEEYITEEYLTEEYITEDITTWDNVETKTFD